MAVSLKEFINELATEASSQGQKLLVLRNYQELPEANVGKDIDILILPNKIRLWYSIFEKTNTELGLDFVSPKVINYCCHKQRIQGLSFGELEVDIEPHLSWRGVDWIDVESVINRSILFKDSIWISHPADECVISFCMSYLYGGFVQDKYLSLMSEQAKQNRNEVTELMAYIFGKKIAKRIIVSLIEKDIREISLKATNYRIRVLFRGFLRHPLSFLYTFFLGYYLEFKNKLFSHKK